MRPECQKYFLEAIALSEKFIQLADKAQCDCNDDRCMVLFGIILDSASKIHLEAEIRLKTLAEEGSKRGAKNRGAPFRDERAIKRL